MPAIMKNRKAPRSSSGITAGTVIRSNSGSYRGLSVPDGDAGNTSDDNYQKHNIPDESKCKRRREKVSGVQVMAGVCFSIFLILFISGIDLQAEKNLQIRSNGNLVSSLAYIRHIQEWSRVVTADGNVCRYDGHCPVRSTCAVSGSDMRGTCEPILIKGSPFSQTYAPQSCLDACLKELQKDEHFYQEKWPNVDWSEAVSSEGRPEGCLLAYHRQADSNQNWKDLDGQDHQAKWHGVPPSIVDWDRERFRHIKRVDPLNDDVSDSTWIAYCTQPCQRDAECATVNDPPWGPSGFVCIENACQRNPDYWGDAVSVNAVLPSDVDLAAPLEQFKSLSTTLNLTALVATSAAEMVLVTGATSSYYHGLVNLAASARYWAPRHKMVVYNLGGLTKTQIAEISDWPNILTVEWQEGVPDNYPGHVQEGKKYAWKPIIVNETVHKYKAIFWLDAGNTLAGPLDSIERIIKRQGIMLVKGQDLSMKISDPRTYEWFGYNKDSMTTGPHYSGNTQAFLYPSRYIDLIVLPNAKCALDANCIAPTGTSTVNHRFDQTTISILAYSPKAQLPHYTEFLAAERAQLNQDLSKPSFKIIWTARQACRYYSESEGKLWKKQTKHLAPSGREHQQHQQRRVQVRTGSDDFVTFQRTSIRQISVTENVTMKHQPQTFSAVNVTSQTYKFELQPLEKELLQAYVRNGGDPYEFLEMLRQKK